MGWNDPNVYYDPEKFGLTTVGEFDLSEPDYSFNIFAVWQDGTGQLYYDIDSGCSCPAPFEDCRSVADLTKVTAHELAQEISEQLAEIESDKWATDYFKARARSEVADLPSRVMLHG